MTISPFDLLLLLGCLQGFILASLLWFNRKGNRLSNRLLGALIGLLALMSLAVVIPATNHWVSLALELLPLIMVMPLGPLIFFYTKSVLDPAFQLGKIQRRHFYPVVLDWGAKLMGWIFFTGAILGYFREAQGPAWGDVMDQYNTYVDIPRWLSLTVYLLLTRKLLYENRPTDKAGTKPQNLPWLRQLVRVFLVFQGLWLLFLIPYSIPSLRGPLLDTFGWYPIYLPVAILIYWLGLKGYLHSWTGSPAEAIRKASTMAYPIETVEKTVEALIHAMQTDNLYLDPELTVEKLGRHVQLPQKTVSFVINQHLQKSFNTFVNEYRVEAVKQRLTDPGFAHLTLTGIAFESGFNSQATFQRTFKQLTGLSPKEYAGQQDKKYFSNPDLSS
jgi:AraC-like DNA-binding protein